MLENFQKLCIFLHNFFIFENFNISKSTIISVKAANLLGYAKNSITPGGDYLEM
jgi:hypothetical protein